MSKVLVTGANGYLALHIVSEFIKEGHHVKGSVRNLNDAEKIEPLRKIGLVELVEADLLDADSWKEACKDIDIVIHTASPVPASHDLQDENEITKAAVEGTLNVLHAALDAKVKRVVLTSSGLTVYNYSFENRIYSEKDWIKPDEAKTAYQKSKILAEQAAWEFVEERKKSNLDCFEFAVIIPVWVLGPVLNPAMGYSVTRFSSAFDTEKEIENFLIGICDVRDVALAHLRAAFLSEAVGHRHLIASPPTVFSTQDWLDILSTNGYKVSRTVGTVDKTKIEKARIDISRMRDVLAIEPTDITRTILDMTESLIKYGIVNQN